MKNKTRYAVHRWLDIWHESVPKSLIPKLDTVKIYEDRMERTKENLYSAYSVLEEFESVGITYNEEEKNFIEKIASYATKEDASYFRIIYY